MVASAEAAAAAGKESGRIISPLAATADTLVHTLTTLLSPSQLASYGLTASKTFASQYDEEYGDIRPASDVDGRS